MVEIIQHLKSEGYEPGEFVPDGRVHRFAVDKSDKKKSAFYIGFRNFSSRTGEEFYTVTYGSWRGEETKTFSTLKGVTNAADNKAIKEQIKKAKEKAEKEREQEQDIVSNELAILWTTLGDSGNAIEYLRKKQISEIALGVKYDERGNLSIPARDCEGRIWSVQYINRDGAKWFHPGGRIRGCFHAIGDIGTSDLLYIAEGIATAATVFLATGRPTIAAFTSNNLAEVSLSLKKLYPDKSIIICGDDDRNGKRPNGDPYNAGREKAEEAARSVMGPAVFPSFNKTNEKDTDWNDLYCREGIETVRNQIAQTKVEKQYLLALGFKEKEYFYTSSKNQQIVGISRFSKSDFVNLMPLEYWEVCFPGAGAARVDWDLAMSSMMDTARKKGIFESQNIRGAGVWNDRGRVVVNMGDHLIVDGKRTDLGEIKSEYFYTLGIKLPGLNPNPLSDEECKTIIEACHTFKWKKTDFGFLLAGAMVTTRVCGALPIRPHIWITGSAGQGKSTLLEKFIYPLIGKCEYLGGNSTEAGIRQIVSANAVPVLFEEFENNGKKSEEIIQSNLDLMRLAWSETHASIVKGGSSGVATSYQVRFAAIVTSIRQVAMSDADQSRFATVELSPHGDDKDHWEQLKSLLSKIDKEFGERLFARVIKFLPVLLNNFKTMKKAMKGGQRFSDQYGMLLAGYGLLMQDDPITEEQAKILASHIALEDEREAAKDTDHESALGHLLTTKYSYEGHNCRGESLIGDLIRCGKEPEKSIIETKALLQLGIRICLETGSVLIASGNHAELQSKVWQNTRWSRAWATPLLRLTNAKRTQQRIGAKTTRCISIPLSHF